MRQGLQRRKPPPKAHKTAAQAYPGQGVEGAAVAAASAAVDELASAAPRARNKGNPPTTEPSGTGLLLEVECRSGIQAEWIGLGCKPSVKAAAILSHCRDRTGMQELDTLSIWPDGSTLDLRVAIGDSLRAGESPWGGGGVSTFPGEVVPRPFGLTPSSGEEGPCLPGGASAGSRVRTRLPGLRLGASGFPGHWAQNRLLEASTRACQK